MLKLYSIWLCFQCESVFPTASASLSSTREMTWGNVANAHRNCTWAGHVVAGHAGAGHIGAGHIGAGHGGTSFSLLVVLRTLLFHFLTSLYLPLAMFRTGGMWQVYLSTNQEEGLMFLPLIQAGLQQRVQRSQPGGPGLPGPSAQQGSTRHPRVTLGRQC